jgi:hypothetical protein
MGAGAIVLKDSLALGLRLLTTVETVNSVLYQLLLVIMSYVWLLPS